MTKENLEKCKLALEIAGLLLGFGAAFGGLLIFLYCVSEGISLRNLTVSDTLVLLHVLFSFVVIFVIGIVYGTFAMVWFMRCLQLVGKLLGKDAKPFAHSDMNKWMLCLMSALMFFLFAGITLTGNSTRAEPFYPILGYFSMNGLFVLIILFCRDKDETLTYKKKTGYLALIMVATLMAFKPALMNFAFINMGVRSSPSDVLILNQKAKEEIEAYFKDINRQWTVCSPNNGKHWITQDVRTIWNGIGDVSYVRLLDPSHAHKKSYEPLVPVSSADIKLMRDVPTQNLCANGAEKK
jgi:hypothetical protein